MLIQLIWTNVKVTFLESTHTKNKKKQKTKAFMCSSGDHPIGQISQSS